MKSHFVPLYSALKLLLAAALLVLVSDLAGAEMASIYGGRDGLCGHPTADGERLNCAELTAAHRTLAFGTRVRVCHSGCVTVRINDRGHGFAAGTLTCHRQQLGQSVFPRLGASP
jgi:Lytic transglycolase